MTRILYIYVIYLLSGSYFHSYSQESMEQLYSVIKNTKIDSVKSKAYLSLGGLYAKKHNIVKSIDNYKNALKIIASKKHLKYLILAAQIKNHLAQQYSLTGKYTDALKLLHENILLYEKIKDENSLAVSYQLISYIYFLVHNYTLSTRYMSLAYNIYIKEPTKHRESLIKVLSNLGIFNIRTKKYDIARKYLEQALSLNMPIGNPSVDAAILNNLANLYLQANQLDSALHYALKPLALAQKHVIPDQSFNVTLGVLAAIHEARHEYAKSLEYSTLCLERYNEISDNLNKIELLKNRAGVFEALGQYQNAYISFKQACLLDDSLHNRKKLNELYLLKNQFDVAKKQHQIDALEKENKIRQLQQKMQQIKNNELQKEKKIQLVKNKLLALTTIHLQDLSKLQRKNLLFEKAKNEANQKKQNLVLLLFIIFLCLSVYIYINYRRKIKIVDKIRMQKLAIEQQAILLDISNKTKNKLFSIISHDLRSPIADLQMALNNFNLDESMSKTSLVKLSYKVTNMNSLLDNLLSWTITQMDEIKPRMQAIKLYDIVSDVTNQLHFKSSAKNITIINSLDLNTTCYSDESYLTIVLRNIVDNAIKYTEREGYIRIFSTSNQDYISIVVSDTGIGINSEAIPLILSDFSSQVGTAGEQGTGLGLKLCQDLLNKIGGFLVINSEMGLGTKVTISLPLKYAL